MVKETLLQPVKPGARAGWILANVLMLLSLAADGHAAGTEKRYALAGGSGFFQMVVPDDWSDVFDANSQPPLVSLRQSQGQPFIVSVAPLPAAAGKAVSTRAELMHEVGDMAAAIRPFAVEQDIKVSELAGAPGPGYYFFATDAAPAPGDYKFMTRGKLRVGELAVTFTILTNEGQDAIIKSALDMLKTAVHVRSSL